VSRLRWAQRLQSISQAGLTYARDPYDRERYQALQELAAELAAGQDEALRAPLLEALRAERGYPTPKVDVRAVVAKDGKLLLLREAQDGFWSLPGGWADLGESPREIAEREVREETGYAVRAVKLLAVYDKAKHEHPQSLWHCYKLFLLCQLQDVPPEPPGHEALAIGFFGADELPPLSLERVTVAQLLRMFEHVAHPEYPTDFD
jgi:ADP-ribose pyrophosphatase YjhB (NUDIX family)